jgi:phage terminase large subunit-like protein
MIDLPPGTLTGSRFLEGRIPDPLGYGARAVRFIENLQHTEGALAGRPFKLHPWQAKIPRKVFGDVDRHGRRKIRTVFLLWPRGCGKTTMVSALGLLCLLGPEKDAAGQVICAAADRGQASIAFDSACRMVRADPRLSACTRIVTNTKTIHHPKSESIYRAISHESYTKHGLNISCLLADEVHVWPTRDLWEVLTTSQGKRDQPLTIITTTAGVGRTGIAWELYDYALKVERGEIDDPTFLPVLYQAPADCDWRDEALWHAVNPALGKFRSLDEMRRSALRAAQSPVELAAFKRFYLNIWAEANETPWLDMDLYDKSAGERVTSRPSAAAAATSASTWRRRAILRRSRSRRTATATPGSSGFCNIVPRTKFASAPRRACRMLIGLRRASCCRRLATRLTRIGYSPTS